MGGGGKDQAGHRPIVSVWRKRAKPSALLARATGDGQDFGSRRTKPEIFPLTPLTLFIKVSDMDSNWASDTSPIRTFMERPPLPPSPRAHDDFVRPVGTTAPASVGGPDRQARRLIGYWMAVSVAPLVGCFLVARGQALKDANRLVAPTRRVAQGLLPPLTAGFCHQPGDSAARQFARRHRAERRDFARVVAMLWLPLGWVILYGCAINAAAFFMPGA